LKNLEKRINDPVQENEELNRAMAQQRFSDLTLKLILKTFLNLLTLNVTRVVFHRQCFSKMIALKTHKI
jgi:hypothetical protein